MIDTHCHLDLYDNPLAIAKKCEALGIMTIGMTNLPSHFELGFRHLLTFKKVRLALGLHPLYAEFHQEEIHRFIQNIRYTSYVGEIGLDFSREGISTKELQLRSFRIILAELSGKQKVLSLHSRGAEPEVLSLLITHKIQLAIFHWYSGPLELISKITDAGFYLSVNPAMIKSKSGQKVIAAIPKEFVLTESDGPFVEVNGKPATPEDISLVLQYFSTVWRMDMNSVQQTIKQNFLRLIEPIAKDRA